MTAPILAAGTWTTNADLIADVARLGYLRDDMLTLDPTWGKGTFWAKWRPRLLHASDIVATKSPTGTSIDATDLPYPDALFDAVVLDPDYKLTGTDAGGGDRYGVDVAKTRTERLGDMGKILLEGTRVLRPGGTLLFKCQDQVEGGRKRWQSRTFANLGEDNGLVLVDQLLFPSYRPQPERSTCRWCRHKVMRRADGRWGTIKRSGGGDPFGCPSAGPHEPDPDAPGQDGSHVNYSVLLVFTKAGTR